MRLLVGGHLGHLLGTPPRTPLHPRYAPLHTNTSAPSLGTDPWRMDSPLLPLRIWPQVPWLALSETATSSLRHTATIIPLLPIPAHAFAAASIGVRPTPRPRNLSARSTTIPRPIHRGGRRRSRRALPASRAPGQPEQVAPLRVGRGDPSTGVAEAAGGVPTAGVPEPTRRQHPRQLRGESPRHQAVTDGVIGARGTETWTSVLPHPTNGC